MTTQDFANMINKFDFFYEMSDSSRTFDAGTSSERAIKATAAKMSIEEFIEAKALITVSQELLERYFAGIFPTIEPNPTPTQPVVKAETPNSELFKTAWAIFKKGLATSFSIALKKAWIIMRIKLGGQTVITFAKETGELRNALVLSIGKLDTVSRGFVRFTENINGLQLWRSFRIDRLLTA